jgi:hypothetical protein
MSDHLQCEMHRLAMAQQRVAEHLELGDELADNFLRPAELLLQAAQQLIGLGFRVSEIVIGELAKSVLKLRLEPVPIPFEF